MSKPLKSHILSLGHLLGVVGLLLSSTPSFAGTLNPVEEESETPSSVVFNSSDFNRDQLLTPYVGGGSFGFQFLNPNRFSMHQSYSLSMGAGGGGSYSSGLYLNTFAYKLANPLTLSLDLGFHTPIYNSMSHGPSTSLWNGDSRPSFVLPRIGLDYKPTENTSFSLQIINGRDANKAYGYPEASPFWRPW